MTDQEIKIDLDLDYDRICPKHKTPFWRDTEVCPKCRREFLDGCTKGMPEWLIERLMKRSSLFPYGVKR